jgi:hypothetical protein
VITSHDGAALTVFNRAAFDAAHTKFLEAPTTLTDDDIEQFAIVLPKLGDRARAKRQNLVPAETADERKMLDARATRRDMMQGFEDVIFANRRQTLPPRHMVGTARNELAES